MYADELISREEPNEKMGGLRRENERLENELKNDVLSSDEWRAVESNLEQHVQTIGSKAGAAGSGRQ